MKYKLLAAVVGLLVVSLSVLAHDMWLVPDWFILDEGKAIGVAVATGDLFPESDSAVAPERVAGFKLISAKGETEASSLRAEGNYLVGQVAPDQPGNYLVALALKPRFIQLAAKDFNEYLEHEGLKGILAARAGQGRSNAEGREFYTKFAKALIQVGGRNDDTYAKVVGHRIEVVPQANPYGLKAGATLMAKVLFDGKPLPDVQIGFGHDRYGKQGFAFTTRTDKDGLAKIPLVNTGRWYVHALHMQPHANTKDADWESFWATLTFEVR
jgi:uncharacterized GH25 family protein